MCQEKEEEDSPILKIACILQNDDLRTALKKSKERLITVTSNSNTKQYYKDQLYESEN